MIKRIKQKLSKILMSFIAITMVSGNISYMGLGLAEVLAAENDNAIVFQAFLGDENTKYSSQTLDSNSENAVHMIVQVNKGYLKDAKITIAGIEKEQSKNFDILSIKNENQIVASGDNTTISLNQITEGSRENIELQIKPNFENRISTDYLNTKNKFVLEGTYVNSQGKEEKVKKEASVEIRWTSNREANLTAEVTKYVPFTTTNEQGVLLQVKLTSSMLQAQEQVQRNLPIQKTEIDFTVPKLNGQIPSYVNVISNGTEYTNGLSAEQYALQKDSNWSYDTMRQQLKIKVENLPDANGTVYAGENKQKEDEVLVTLVYPQEAMANTNKITLAADSTITMYDGVNNSTTQSKQIMQEVMLTNTIQDITSIKVEAKQDSLEKGYLYANYTVENKVDTVFEETWTANIGYAAILEGIRLTGQEDTLVKENGEELSGNGATYYQKTVISKNNMLDILGQEGTITIKDGTGKVLLTLNKDTQTDDNGNMILVYQDKTVSSLIIETSKPQKEGNLEIYHIKAISSQSPYTMGVTKELKTVKVKANVTKIMDEVETLANTEIASEDTIALTETYTKADLEINKTNLSTAVVNNVEIKAILRTDSTKYDLYEAPVLEIVLPKAVKTVKFNSSNLVAPEGLKIENTATYVNEEGNTVIRVTLSGKQTGYTIGQVVPGPVVVINADITLDPMAVSEDTNIVLNYTNQSAQGYENGAEIGTAQAKVKVLAPTEILTNNEIVNYDAGESVSAINTAETGKLAITEGNRAATMKQTLVNNTGNTITNVSILGRIPFKGNKEIGTNKDLGTTFDSKMISKLVAAGIEEKDYTVYYSENGEATQALDLAQNGWNKDLSIEKAKSYLIVLNKDIENGAKIEFSYNIEIPEGLGTDNAAYGTYKVYYDNNSEIGTIEEDKTAPTVGVSTGESPKLEVTISSDLEKDAQVREGQIVRFYANVKNTGNVEAEEVVVKLPTIAGVKYTNYDKQNGIFSDNLDGTVTVGTIAKGETKQVEFYMTIDTITPEMFCTNKDHFNQTTGKHKDSAYELICTKPEHFTEVNGKKVHIDDFPDYDGPSLIGDATEYKKVEYTHKDEEYQNNISAQVSLGAKNLKEEVTSNTYPIVAKKGYLTIVHTADEPDFVFTQGTDISYYTQVTNTTDTDMKNVKVTVNLPENVTVTDCSIWKAGEGKDRENITSNKNIAEITIPSLPAGEHVFIETVAEAGTVNGELRSYAVASAENIPEHTSNELVLNSREISVTIEQETVGNEYIKEKEAFTYKFTIKNNSDTKAFGIRFEDVLPEGVSYQGTEYIIRNIVDGQEQNITNSKYDISGRTVMLQRDMGPNETLEITIKVRADVLDGTEDKEIINTATLSGNAIDTVNSNSVRKVIEYVAENHQGGNTGDGGGNQGGDNTPAPNTYKITGTAWLDENKDGKKDENEQRISGVQVMLLDKATSAIIRDSNGNTMIVTTNEKGEYTFNGVPNGTYMIVFLPDLSNYDLAEYRKQGVSDDANSDAIAMKINIGGKIQNGAVSDTITVAGENVRNIDIGLVTAEKFDLSLAKYVSSVTVSNSKGTKEYTYEDKTTMAKVDIYRKDVTGSNVIIKYKIVITNTGAVPGYAKQIVDYIPSGMKFNSELNKDWYLSDNGNVYNSSLANTVINPGQSKELTLILTKTMTGDNVGMVNNNAEIYESYNEKGLEDTDSTPANKVETEDDYGTANVLISVETGTVVLYTAITIASIAILGVGIFSIKKYVLHKGK